jgi:hypothetical protein
VASGSLNVLLVIPEYSRHPWRSRYAPPSAFALAMVQSQSLFRGNEHGVGNFRFRPHKVSDGLGFLTAARVTRRSGAMRLTRWAIRTLRRNSKLLPELL